MKKHRQMLNFYRLIFFCRKLESNQYQNLTRNPFYRLNYIGFWFCCVACVPYNLVRRKGRVALAPCGAACRTPAFRKGRVVLLRK